MTSTQPPALERAAARACDIEIVTHTVILTTLIVPIFGGVGMLSLLKMAVWAGVADAAPITNALIPDAPSRQQLIFEGHITQAAWMLVVAGAIALMWLFVDQTRRQQAVATDNRLGETRRFRAVPVNYRKGIEQHVLQLWRTIDGKGAAPEVLLFAASGILACSQANAGVPAIAVSTSFLERFNESQGSDPLLDAILLHELAHITRNDMNRLAQANALLGVARTAFLAVMFLVVSTMTVWNILDKLSIPGTSETMEASVGARVVEVLRGGSFAYLLLVIIGRYTSLIIMLTELRADVLAAMWFGGVKRFAATVAAEKQTRRPIWTDTLSALFGIRVTHLTSNERVKLLEREHRLLTPKIRYFAYSLALPMVLMVNGFVGFGSFQWIIQAGLVAVIAAFNTLTCLMLVNAAVVYEAIPWRRLLVLGLTLAFFNGWMLVSVYEVIGRSSELLTAAFDANFHESAEAVGRRAVALERALLHPFDWHLAIWAPAACVGVWLVHRSTQGIVSRPAISALTGSGVFVITVLAFLASPHAPPNPARLRLQEAPYYQEIANTVVPIAGIGAGALIGWFVRVYRRSRWQL